MFEYWRSMRRIGRISNEQRAIVFYSESKDDWGHLSPILNHLVTHHKKTVCYLSSAADDPGLFQEDPRIVPFLIGKGAVRTIIFRTIRARVVVMTLPDFGNYNIKRSPYSAHYVYVHHSAVSSHMAYRKKAFDNFESILCVGPHHVAETRKAEELYNLPAKTLVNHGSGRLDAILKADAATREDRTKRRRRVVIAPSWSGDRGAEIIEALGGRLIEPFLAEGFHVTIRPHSMTKRKSAKHLKELLERYSATSRFHYDDDMSTSHSLANADLLVSDWSGAAFDFAFGFLRPVLFVDMPRKVNNPDYQNMGMVPIEVKIREEIGAIVNPGEIETAGSIASRLMENPPEFRDRIARSRSKWIFNLGSSGPVGADHIANVADSRPD